VAAAQAQREQLAAEDRKVASDLTRVRTLADKGYSSRQALDAAEAAAAASRAAVRAALAQLAVRRSELAVARGALLGPEAGGGQTVAAVSPASGYVTRVLQESERMVAMGAPLLEVGDQSGLEAAIEFLSQDAVRIREGMAAEIYDWGGPGALPAIVRRVEPQAFTKVSALGVEEQRVLVLLQFEGDPKVWTRLAPGYRLWGRVFLRKEAKALRAPLGALVRTGEGWAVYRVRNGRVALTPIAVGALTDRLAEVRRGLSPGDQLVVFPSDRVREGVRVKARTVESSS
jgi:HlyD family secretion protein